MIPSSLYYPAARQMINDHERRRMSIRMMYDPNPRCITYLTLTLTIDTAQCYELHLLVRAMKLGRGGHLGDAVGERGMNVYIFVQSG